MITTTIDSFGDLSFIQRQDFNVKGEDEFNATSYSYVLKEDQKFNNDLNSVRYPKLATLTDREVRIEDGSYLIASEPLPGSASNFKSQFDVEE
jgi:hypothetical protein